MGFRLRKGNLEKSMTFSCIDGSLCRKLKKKKKNKKKKSLKKIKEKKKKKKSLKKKI